MDHYQQDAQHPRGANHPTIMIHPKGVNHPIVTIHPKGGRSKDVNQGDMTIGNNHNQLRGHDHWEQSQPIKGS